jgi:hypothetical protein
MEIGFWRRYEDTTVDPRDDRPWPIPKTAGGGGAKLNKEVEDVVIEYLKIGYIESYEFGYATCRLCGTFCDEMGCCSLSDGTYVWPEGLVHYVQQHDVDLPPEFVAHANKNIEQLREHQKNRVLTPEEVSLSAWREQQKLKFIKDVEDGHSRMNSLNCSLQ